MKEKQTKQALDKGQIQRPDEEVEEEARREEDSRVTWTGKRVRSAGGVGAAGDGDGSSAGGVGKYLKATLAERADNNGQDEDEIVEFVDEEPEPEPARKKVKSGTGGFGDFSSW